MIGKKINQLATELAPVSTDLTIIGDPISGVSKKITLAQLGAIFSGAVSFYTDLASFPTTGDINVIYCAKDTQKLYLWSGSAYTEVFPSQALLDTYQLRSEKGNANGYASLDSGGKVPISQLPSSIMEYKGTWNASTNTPTLANGTGDTGDVYICNVAGTVNFGAGAIAFAVGDYVIYSGSIWQRSSGAVGTVTSVALTVGGDAISVSGSPLTTSGTLGLTFNGTTAQYIRGNGTLETFPTLTGFVPYTGATANVDLGTFDLTADIINLNQLKAVGSGGLNIYSNSGTHIALMGGGGGAGVTFYGGVVGTTGAFTSSGSTDTFGITHSSGSGIALNITKGGNGEGLYINKTSGSGNAATIIGTLNATTLVKSGGTSAQFLKADGSVDSNTYVTIDTFETITASKNFALGLSLGSAGGTNQASVFQNTSSLFSGSAGVNVFGFNSANNIYFGKGSDNGGVLQWSNSTVRYYTLPNATGTLALTSDLTGGTVTSVGLSSATSGVTIGSTPITTSGTITLAIATASGSQQGLLSSTDWTTFNNKQNALTNPVTGTGTTNYLPKFTGASTIGNSIMVEGTNGIGVNNTSPNTSYGLTVSGPTLYSSNALRLERNGISAQGLNISAGGEVVTFNGFNTASDGLNSAFVWTSTAFSTTTTRMTLNASGNLGLGVTPSAWNTVQPVFQIGYTAFSAYQNTQAIYSSNAVYTSGWKYLSNTNATYYSQNEAAAGVHAWFNAPSGTAGNTISFTQAMTLNASGNLSIGNTNDTYKLDVTGTGRFTNTLQLDKAGGLAFRAYYGSGNNSPLDINVDAANGDASLTFNTTYNSGWKYYVSNFAARISNAGTLKFQVAPNGTAGNTISWVDALAFNNSTGAATFSSSVEAARYLATSSSASLVAFGVSAGNGMYNAGTDVVAFSTASTERMRITSGGFIGINTTSPAARLTVIGATTVIGQTNVSARFSDDQQSTLLISHPGSTSATATITGNEQLGFATGAVGSIAERMRIKSNGIINLSNVPSSSAGLSSGDIYKTVAGILMIV